MSIDTVVYDTHNNEWNFLSVRASLNLFARVAKSSIYFCEVVEYTVYTV